MDKNKSLTLKSFKGNVADHGSGRSFTMTADNGLKITSDHSWDFGTNRYYGVDLLGGFSWPPRSYTCSFCKREFKSAQALGGHMNVHRRDRARLRQSPPWETQLSSNLETSSEPNVSPYIPSAKQLPPFSFTHPKLCTPSNIASLMCSSTTMASSTADHHQKVIEKEMGGIKTSTSEDLAITMKALKELKEDDCKDLERGEILMLDLDIGLCSNPNEDLDLELRLGYA